VLIAGGKTVRRAAPPCRTRRCFSILARSGFGTWVDAGTMKERRQQHTATLLSSNAPGAARCSSPVARMPRPRPSPRPTLHGLDNTWRLHRTYSPDQGTHGYLWETASFSLRRRQRYDATRLRALRSVSGPDVHTNGQCATGICANGVCCDQTCTAPVLRLHT